MKRLILLVLVFLVVGMPLLAMAAPPPPAGGGGSNFMASPEPIAGLLIALGAVPAYLVYRRSRRTTGCDRQPPG